MARRNDMNLTYERGAYAYAEAQRYRSPRAPVPCWRCGEVDGCKHRRGA